LELKNQTSTDNTSGKISQTVSDNTSKKEITIEDTKKQSPEKIHTQIPQNIETVSDVKKEFDDLFFKVKDSYTEHKIEDAFDDFEAMKAIRKRDNLQKDVKTHIESIFNQNVEYFAQLEEERKDIIFMVRQMEDDEGWNLEKVKKGFTVKYKKNAGDTYSLKMEGIIEVPVFNVLTLIYEPEGHPAWLPFCSKANEIKKIHRSCKAIYQKYDFPLPLSDRETYVCGFGADRFDRNGSILVITKSFHDDKNLQKKLGLVVPEKSKCVRMDVEFMGMEIVPMGREKIKFKAVVKMNPHVKYIPLSFINFMTRKAALTILEKLTKKAKNLKGSKWEESIQNNREFYGWLEANIEKFLKRKGLYK